MVGRPVRIGGEVRFTLLPRPVLAASDVTVADAGDGVSLTARALRLQVALAPLLAGRIDARELVLSGPVLRLPWPLAYRPALARPPPWLARAAARIEDGTLIVGGVAVPGIDASLGADALTGTLSAAGTARLDGAPWRFAARLSRPEPDGGAGLDLTLDGQGAVRGTVARFTGRLAGDGAISGAIAGQGPDLSRLLPVPALAWKAGGKLTASGGLIAADGLALDIGGVPATGTVALRVAPKPRLDLSLAAARLDLDDWLPVLARAPGSALLTGALPTGIDLSAELASLGYAQVRHLRLAFDVAEGAKVTVREASASLPGEATLRLAGMVAPAGGGPRFVGTARLAAPDLRATLHWLARLGPAGLDALPPGVLRAAELSGRIAADSGEVALSGLHGTIDDQAVGGAVGLALDGRPRVVATLRLDRLDLDPWLPEGVSRLPGPFAGFDARLQLRAARASWRGAALQSLVLDAQSDSGRLAVDRLTADLGGLHLDAAGSVGAEGRVSGARLDLSAPDAQAVAKLLPAGWRVPPGLWSGAASLHATASGPPDALGMRIAAELGEARIEAQPVLDLRTARWSGPVALRHPAASRLLAALGWPGGASWAGAGPLVLTADLAVAPDALQATGFDLSAGGFRAHGELALERGQAGPALSGRIEAASLPLPLPSPRSAEPMRLIAAIGAARGWTASVSVRAAHVLDGAAPLLDQASATLALRDGALRLDDVSARLGAGALTGAASLDAAAEPPRLRAEAHLSGATVTGPVLGAPLDLVGGKLDGAISVQASGHSPAALLATLSGEAGARAAEGRVAGFDLPALADALASGGPAALGAARAALLGGITGFDRLDVRGRIAEGALVLDGTTMTAPRGDAALSGSVDLAGGTVDLRLSLRPDGPGQHPEAAVVLAGPIAAPRRVPELAGVAQWLAARQE